MYGKSTVETQTRHLKGETVSLKSVTLLLRELVSLGPFFSETSFNRRREAVGSDGKCCGL